jgi:hypothetical protein
MFWVMETLLAFWARVSVVHRWAERLINSLSINARTASANHHSKVEKQELQPREGNFRADVFFK